MRMKGEECVTVCRIFRGGGARENRKEEGVLMHMARAEVACMKRI